MTVALCEEPLMVNGEHLGDGKDERGAKDTNVREVVQSNGHGDHGHEPGPPPEPYNWQINYSQLIGLTFLHITALAGLVYMAITLNWRLVLVNYVSGTMSLIGVTAGAHRLWAHRSYKARFPLRVLLAVLFTGSGQRDIYKWSRDHRLHHKYSETDADPHNAKRGFFFAHIGWILAYEHHEVTDKEKTIDMSDLLEDSVVRFHQRHYLALSVVFLFALPTWMSMAYASVGLIPALMATCLRYVFVLQVTYLVNSAAHLYGEHPYDSAINPGELYTLAPILAVGEAYHNYHHTFPQDYKASEFGWMQGYWNLSAMFIDAMAVIGQAYDLKRASDTMILSRRQRTGDLAVKEE